MGWLRRLVIGSDFDRLAEQDAAEMMARNNILEASRRDERRRRMLESPPPVVRWRYQHRSWMRWSELDADWIMAEVPEGLLAYAATLDEITDGTTVGFVEERWQVLGEDREAATERSVDEHEPSAGAADIPEPPPIEATPAPAEPETPTLSVAEQIEAWRRRR